MGVIRKLFNKEFIRKATVIFLIIIISLSFVSCSKKESAEANKTDKVENVAKKEKYTILKKDDISLEDIKRYVYTVVVNEEVSKDELEKISNEIIDKAKKEGEFNGIQILMFDGEYTVSGENVPSLGKYTYAPEGDFAKATEVKKGEYDKMAPLNQLKQVNWNLRPSENIQKIVSMYNELFKQESEKNPDAAINESDIRTKTAELMGINVTDVDDALVKLDEWIWQE